jgi:hypothetical protein
MTITYPRDLPSTRIKKCVFELERNDVTVPETAGRIISVTRGPSLWRMQLETECTQLLWNEWTTWADSLAGSARTFFGYDAYHPFPRRYPTGFTDMTRAGGGSFVGDAIDWGVTTARDEVILYGLPTAFRLSERDYIGFRWSTNKRALVRVLEDASVNGEGTGQWSIQPTLPTVVPEEAIAYLARPTCTMRIVPGTYDPDREGKERRIKFTAIQHLEG